MGKILRWIKTNPHRAMFLVPIVLVAIISISHVVTWYDMANPMSWAIYLSVAIEIAAMTALVAVSNQSKTGVWFMFGIVTLIQVIGNVFFCFKEIDENGELFKAWVELTSPMWELMGTDISNVVGLKRWLAILEGGLLPIISLTSLHFFVNYKLKNEDDTEKYFKKRNQLIVEKVNQNETPEVTPKIEEETQEDNPTNDPPAEVETPPSIEDVEESIPEVVEEVVESPTVKDIKKEDLSSLTKEEKLKFLLKQLADSPDPAALMQRMKEKINEPTLPKETPINNPKKRID